MGPQAGVDLAAKIVHLTHATCDREHIPLLLDSNTAIPDRTAAILGRGEDPVPQLVRSALRLESMGAGVIGVACNTAHHFFPRIRPFLRVPLVHMIEETARECKSRGYRKAGLLATSGTFRSGIYTHSFEREGVEPVLPTPGEEEILMDVIYKGVKAGNMAYPSDGLERLLERFSRQGVEIVVLGCTELPLYFAAHPIWECLLDPTEVLARRLIEAAGGRVRSCR